MSKIQRSRNIIGKILMEDIFDTSGRRLLSSGTVLTEKSLNILANRGIKEVKIEDNKNESSLIVSDVYDDLYGFFENWKSEKIPTGLVAISSTQYKSCNYDVFLPLTKQEDPSNLTLNVVPLEDILKKGSMFTLPEVYYHISRAINSPISSTQDIGDAISRDPSFTAKLLQMANSSLYGFSNKIVSIYQAVSIIGNQQLAMLSVGIAFTRSFQSNILEASSMQNFWKHSIATAIAAKYLAEKADYKEKELFFIAGLLHDIGKMLLYSSIPNSAYILHSLCYSTKAEQQHIERKLLGYDHGEIGEKFIKAHSLSDTLADMVLNHHHPDDANDPPSARIIHYADILANSMKVGSSGQYYVPECNSVADKIKTADTHFFEEIRKRINNLTKEMMAILLIN